VRPSGSLLGFPMARVHIAAAAWGFLAGLAGALHPRPEFNASDKQRSYLAYSRWLVHESDYAIVSTRRGKDEAFGSVVSVADGNNYEHSTGLIYSYLSAESTTYKDLMEDDRVTLTFSEKALAGGQSLGKAGGCANTTAMDPPCGRLTFSGRLMKVPQHRLAEAKEFLFSTHPVMKGWGEAETFVPFWLAPESVTELFLINAYGFARRPELSGYFDAPWRGPPSELPTVSSTPRLLHPRPPASDLASFARWLVHESDYASISMPRRLDKDEVFGNIVSVADGRDREHSTGVIFTYLSKQFSTTYSALMVDNRVTLTFSEKALADGQHGGCANTTAMDSSCGQLTISGRLTKVPDHRLADAEEYLFATHPGMRNWPASHVWMPFWLAPDDMVELDLINENGSAKLSKDAYLSTLPALATLDTTGTSLAQRHGRIRGARSKAMRELRPAPPAL